MSTKALLLVATLSATVGAQISVSSSNMSGAAAADGGNFVVTWLEPEPAHPFYPDAFARLFTSTGSPVGSAFQVHESSSGHQDSPAVGANRGSDVVAAWKSFPQNPDPSSIIARRFSATQARSVPRMSVWNALMLAVVLVPLGWAIGRRSG
jgi:hypothetical protein